MNNDKLIEAVALAKRLNVPIRLMVDSDELSDHAYTYHQVERYDLTGFLLLDGQIFTGIYIHSELDDAGYSEEEVERLMGEVESAVVVYTSATA